MVKNNKMRFFRKIISPMKAMSFSFVHGITEEISRVMKNYLSGAVSFILALFFLAFFWFFLNVMVVVVLVEFLKLPLFLSILIVTIFNLILTLLFFIAGKNKFDENK